MLDYFASLSKPVFTGIASFLAIMGAVIHVYKTTTTPVSREEHKQFLLKQLNKVKSVKLDRIGINAARLYSKILNVFLHKPSINRLEDPAFWNKRTVLLILIFAIIVNILSILPWVENFDQFMLVTAPIHVILGNFGIIVSAELSARRRFNEIKQENSKKKRDIKNEHLKRQSKTTVSDIGMIIRILSIYKIKRYEVYKLYEAIGWFVVPLWLTLTIFWIFAWEVYFVQIALAVLFVYYGNYIVLTMISFNITRLLMLRLQNCKTISDTIKAFLLDILYALIVFILSMIVVGVLISMLRTISPSDLGKFGSFDSQRHYTFLFLSAFIPSIIVLIFGIVQLISKLFIEPAKMVVSVFFEYVVKLNLHIYVASASIAFLIIELISK